jgi:iron-regulated transporter 1
LHLADLNAVIRAIDLTAKILAPTCVGLIMSYGSQMLSAIVIACWNLVSVFVEYGLLKIVYKKVPELANKKLRTSCAGIGCFFF